MKKLLQYGTGPILILLLIAGAWWFYNSQMRRETVVNFRTEPVVRDTLTSSIAGTGTVEPEELVNVGAQVGGMITEFGKDVNGKSVDYGSVVKAGSVLARIDDSLYSAEVKQCEAALKQSEASILQAEAQIEKAKANINLSEANYSLAKINMDRSARLLASQSTSQSDFDACKNSFDSAVATVAQNKAELASYQAQHISALASKSAAEAKLASARYNLNYCVITSPVDGVIIDRRVNIGQTVISSMSAPSLFLLAKDLRRMQIWVTVNEADIGQIKPGQPVWFSVDAFQGEEFQGVVHKIRLNATMSSNVVTYVVEVNTDNSDGKLLPYLTANVKFILAQRENVLIVPNSALRFTPGAQIPGAANVPELASGERLVWTLNSDGQSITPVKVKTGLNNGSSTEIISGNLSENATVVTAAETVTVAAASSSTENKSPFMPTPPHRSNSRNNSKGSTAK